MNKFTPLISLGNNMKLKINFVDAFTESVFRGNPAAVLISDKWLDDAAMQLIAAENNLSETAFAVKYGDNAYDIRWFSPLTEIDFCGHATLASAFVLFRRDSNLEKLILRAESVGELSVTRGNDGYIRMSFPDRKPDKIIDIPEDLVQVLSIRPKEVLLSSQAYFVIYPEEGDVLTVTQDAEKLKKLAPYDVVVTALSEKYDFISRYFWPANGGYEDPVTGSIHAGLAPLWAERLGRSRLTAYQASKRGGVVSCEVEGSRVYISGKAVQYLEGFIEVPFHRNLE